MSDAPEPSKSVKTIYWISTVFAALVWSGGAISALIQAPSSMEVFYRLGFPEYFSTLLGSAQLLGVVAILFPLSKRYREWAYAGLTFDVLSALFSIRATGGPIGFLVFPLLSFVVLQISYWSWQKTLDSRWLIKL
jgi:hypothetical protein